MQRHYVSSRKRRSKKRLTNSQVEKKKNCNVRSTRRKCCGNSRSHVFRSLLGARQRQPNDLVSLNLMMRRQRKIPFQSMRIKLLSSSNEFPFYFIQFSSSYSHKFLSAQRSCGTENQNCLSCSVDSRWSADDHLIITNFLWNSNIENDDFSCLKSV